MLCIFKFLFPEHIALGVCAYNKRESTGNLGALSAPSDNESVFDLTDNSEVIVQGGADKSS